MESSLFAIQQQQQQQTLLLLQLLNEMNKDEWIYDERRKKLIYEKLLN